ncbi:oxygenase MpaB family protein [Leekyejoonella antrihumi]|uniref:DUF2236 domain-containing protein n=1 Tax=Leekyejoonella antrihumi TaxID=1660198 RepID=A0A563E055_9MICO|nr:oxygenase MpaB family protein [Leekyejoonella antrihumi]TWP35591.1 DUF2236 domain-containing protein [Leekyejoonella antrihumi]
MTLTMDRLPRPVLAVHDAVRHRAALALRDRVAGDNATGRADQIWGRPGPRWFTPDDPIWRVHLDASMFLGGIRALLLQSLHPLAMAGVTDFSDYQSDVWGRLQSTSNFISQTTFGTIEDSERLLDRINTIHSHIQGVAPDGRGYAATDPHLLRWVHVAEIDGFLACFEAFGESTLTPQEADTYVAQTGVAAARLGVIDPPQSVADLRAALAAFEPELEITPAAREVLRFILWRPPMPLAARPAYLSLVAGALATLPPYALEMFGVRLPPGGRRGLRLAGNGGAGAIRWMLHDPMVRSDRRMDSRPGDTR